MDDNDAKFSTTSLFKGTKLCFIKFGGFCLCFSCFIECKAHLGSVDYVCASILVKKGQKLAKRKANLNFSKTFKVN